MFALQGRPPGSSCMVCGQDLWDVDRYVSAGAVVVCRDCVRLLNEALDAAHGSGETEVVLPPRVHGPAPDEDAPREVTRAFTLTFRSGEDKLDEFLEDAREIGPLLAQGATRFGPGSQFTARIDAMRFPRPDLAEVRFHILMNGTPTGMPFQGTAVRDDGNWRVTRETVGRVLGSTGVAVPPRRV